MRVTKALATFSALAAVTLAGCSSNASEASTETTTPAAEETTAAAGAVTIEDNRGTVQIPADPKSIVITDNRLFEPAAKWGVKLSAAPIGLLPAGSVYTEEKDLVDLGMHFEPNLEALVAAQPDLVINGQRFQKQYDDIKKLVPDAALVDIDIREGQPFDEELRRQITLAGKIFQKEADAEAMIKDFDASIERVKKAYDGKATVMGVITAKGTLNYSAPSNGRSLGPLFDIFGFKPALNVEGSSDHKGDDISVETMAQANPDIVLVMDRDASLAARKGEEIKPAKAIIDESEALANVSAVKNQKIVYMPVNTYLDESIITYTKFFNDIAEMLEKK
ncbi:MAG: ABC transporter substrate-binding protein [Actinomycetaceae bacterium]|nr:ABC transporter substrate-binding protein [Actinomycetaceae bacterium]